MLPIFAGLLVLSELVFAGAIYVSVAAPDRMPEKLNSIPLRWRLMALFGWSVMSGVVIQLMGVSQALR